MIPTGLIGCGAFGRNHFRVLKELDPPFMGVYDTDEARVGAMAMEAGVPFFTRLEDLLEVVEAVVIAVPTIYHHEVAMAAFEHGCHCLVEKPIAATQAEGEAMVKRAQEAGKVLAIGHIERHNPVVKVLFEHLAKPRYAVVERLSPFTPRSLDIDVVLDLMIHDLQIVLEMAGEAPEDVKALGIPVLSPKVDMATAHLTFPSGFMAHVTASRVSEGRVRKLRLFTESSYTSVDFAEKKIKGYRLVTDDEGPSIREDTPEVKDEEPLMSEIRDFLHACESGSSPLVDGRRGLETLVLAKIIQEAMP